MIAYTNEQGRGTERRQLESAELGTMPVSVEFPRSAFVLPYPVFYGTEAEQFCSSLGRYLLQVFINLDELHGIASCLRENGRIDRDTSSILADKLDPPTDNKDAIRYVLKRAAGRPRLCFPMRSDPIQQAMQSGNLAAIADHLRRAPHVDERVMMWLADQLDPPSPECSRLVIKRPRKKRSIPTALIDERLRLGRAVAESFQKYGKMEAALSDVTAKEFVSRSAAHRAYQSYQQSKAFKKSQIILGCVIR